MHPFKGASHSGLSRPPAPCANSFSFPPTQRRGLLDSTTGSRSSDQKANLKKSYRNLLNALNVTSPQQNGA